MSKYAPDTPPDWLVEDPPCDSCGGDPAACDCALLDAVCDSCGGDITEKLGYCPKCYDGPQTYRSSKE